jgi:hypothetical protein
VCRGVRHANNLKKIGWGHQKVTSIDYLQQMYQLFGGDHESNQSKPNETL